MLTSKYCVNVSPAVQYRQEKKETKPDGEHTITDATESDPATSKRWERGIGGQTNGKL